MAYFLHCNKRTDGFTINATVADSEWLAAVGINDWPFQKNVIPQRVHLFGVGHKRMKAKAFALQLLVATITAAAIAYYAVASVQMSGIVPSDWSAADVIQQRCPFHLLRPGWIKGSDQADILFTWTVVEMKARLLAVCGVWVIGIALLAWRALKSRHHEQTA